MNTKKVMFRDAGTGRLVSAEYAKDHPKTTEREVRPAPVHKPTPKKPSK